MSILRTRRWNGTLRSEGRTARIGQIYSDFAGGDQRREKKVTSDDQTEGRETRSSSTKGALFAASRSSGVRVLDSVPRRQRRRTTQPIVPMQVTARRTRASARKSAGAPADVTAEGEGVGDGTAMALWE